MAAPDAARVTSLESLERFRAGLLEFIDDARNALSEADSEVARLQVWLDGEQKIHWQQELRRRNEQVTRAKSELYRKQVTVSSKDRPPSAIDEKKALRRAEERLAEAEQKLRRIRHWSIHLGQESNRYRAAVASLSAALERDLPASAALLKRAILAIEAYLHTAPPDLRSLLDSIPTAEAPAASMRRGGEVAADATAEPPAEPSRSSSADDASAPEIA
jgi:DNA repair exonuclease SbcCD ATPase subunit